MTGRIRKNETFLAEGGSSEVYADYKNTVDFISNGSNYSVMYYY